MERSEIENIRMVELLRLAYIAGEMYASGITEDDFTDFKIKHKDKIEYFSQLSNTKEEEDKEPEFFISVSWCAKCDPTQAARTYAPTGGGKYKCSTCGNITDYGTPSKNQ